MHCTDKYSQHSSGICLVWLNGLMFIYELSGCGFESCCSHLNFRFRTCFEQGVPWHSGNYRVWIQSEMDIWHDKNIQSIEEHIKKDNNFHIFKHLHSIAACFDSYNSLSYKIIDKASSKFDLKIKKALHINWRKPNLNT